MKERTAELTAGALVIAAALGAGALAYYKPARIFGPRSSTVQSAGKPSDLEKTVTSYVYEARADRTIVREPYTITEPLQLEPGSFVYALPGNKPDEVEAEWVILPSGDMMYIDDDALPEKTNQIPEIPPNAPRVYD